jgi:hypothetical protein
MKLRTSSRSWSLSSLMVASRSPRLSSGERKGRRGAPADLLGERLAQLDQLTPDDRAALIHILNHMLANNRARAALTPHAS